MRQLTTSQKSILDRELKKYNKLDQFGSMDINIRTADDLSDKTWNTLEKINNTEILYQEVNRYITDKVINLIHQPTW